MRTSRVLEENQIGMILPDSSGGLFACHGKTHMEAQVRKSTREILFQLLILAYQQNPVHGIPCYSLSLHLNLSAEHVHLTSEFLDCENTFFDQKTNYRFLFDHLVLDKIFDCFDGLVV